MAWPPDPDEVRRHDERAHRERRGQRYNTPPPASLNRGSGPGRRPGGGHPAGRTCRREFALLSLFVALLGRYAVLAARAGARKARRR